MRIFKDFWFLYRNGIGFKRSMDVAYLMLEYRECPNVIVIDKDLLVS
ncbi:MAG: hypothetical protein KAZ14_00160 [Nitrosomonas sp.]|nr:hypothetical protein [Nitrosomonas sp.]